MITYDNSKGEHVRRLVDLALRMSFWRTPHPIAYLYANNSAIRGDICRIFNVSELGLLDVCPKMVFHRLHEDVIRLDICSASVHDLSGGGQG